MKTKTFLSYLMVGALLGGPVAAAAAMRTSAGVAGVLGFREWKRTKIDEAKSLVNEAQEDLKKNKNTKGLDEDPEKRLDEAKLSLSAAKDLSANDYFVMYVRPTAKGDVELIRKAARSLNAKDVSEILLAYQKKLDGQTADVTSLPLFDADDSGTPSPPATNEASKDPTNTKNVSAIP